MSEIYLDNSATTRPYDEVVEEMARVYREHYGNPASAHHRGVDAEAVIRNAKKTIADTMRVSPSDIYFTSGGTESDNWALMGIAEGYCRSGKHLITTKIEHPAILQTMQHLEKDGYRVTYLSVDEKGQIDPQELKSAITPETILVSIMHTNNEMGAVQPIEEIGRLIKNINPGTLFHVDAVQGYGKDTIYPKQMKVDLLSASAHKIHGPKGIGFLYVGEKIKLLPILYGGGQQGGMRSGTENTPAVAGFALAAQRIYATCKEDRERLLRCKKRLCEGIETIGNVKINNPLGEEGAPHIVSASFPGLRSEVLLHALEEKEIYVSAGSACAAHKNTPSGTLTAIGLPREYADSTIRFSMSVFTTEEEIDETISALKEIVPELRKYTRR